MLLDVPDEPLQLLCALRRRVLAQDALAGALADGATLRLRHVDEPVNDVPTRR
jgi:hypothetical protein